MANHFYNSITTKDCHPWITAEVCHPRIMASCIRNLNLTTVCTCNRITAEVCHPRIMASCIRKLNLTTVCTCNRIMAEVCHPRIMASCIRNWNLTTVCICNRTTASRNCDLSPGKLPFTLAHKYKPAKLQHYGFRKDGRNIGLSRMRASPSIKPKLSEYSCNRMD